MLSPTNNLTEVKDVFLTPYRVAFENQETKLDASINKVALRILAGIFAITLWLPFTIIGMYLPSKNAVTKTAGKILKPDDSEKERQVDKVIEEVKAEPAKKRVVKKEVERPTPLHQLTFASPEFKQMMAQWKSGLLPIVLHPGDKILVRNVKRRTADMTPLEKWQNGMLTYDEWRDFISKKNIFEKLPADMPSKKEIKSEQDYNDYVEDLQLNHKCLPCTIHAFINKCEAPQREFFHGTSFQAAVDILKKESFDVQSEPHHILSHGSGVYMTMTTEQAAPFARLHGDDGRIMSAKVKQGISWASIDQDRWVLWKEQYLEPFVIGCLKEAGEGERKMKHSPFYRALLAELAKEVIVSSGYNAFFVRGKEGDGYVYLPDPSVIEEMSIPDKCTV